jgi:signal transduction histidine kinase
MGLAPVREWLDAKLRAAMEASDLERAQASSSPRLLPVAPAGMLAVLCMVAYGPPVSTLSHFQYAWVSIALVLVGTVLTIVAYYHSFDSTIGAICTLVDNGCYSSAFAFAAIQTEGTVATALAIVHALMVLAFPAQIYGLSLLFGLVMMLPLAGLLVAFQPSALITIVLVSTGIMTLALSELTRQRVEMAARQKRLQQALGAAEHVAEESMQAALGTTLLSLGHFLHELRNLQTVTSTDLAFLEMHANLDEDCAEVLGEARDAQRKMTQLVTATVESLKQRSRAVSKAFPLQDVVDRVVQESRGAEVSTQGRELGLILHGNPEHMHAVLQNLVRNAVQAGARNVRIETQLEPSGQAAVLTVHDDGPGIPESQSGRLFEAFTESTKIAGTGLGLYLCRRYLGLFGGTIEAGVGPLGGASFRIRLPAKVVVSGRGEHELEIAATA